MRGDDEHSRTPLLWLLAPFVAGLLLACLSPPPFAPVAVAAVGLLPALLAAAIAWRRREPRLPMTWAGSICLAAFLGGLSWMQHHLLAPERWSMLPAREATLEVRVERLFPPAEGIDRVSFLGRITGASRLTFDLVGQRVFCSARPPDGWPLVKTAEIRVAGLVGTLVPAGATAGGFEGYLLASGVRFRLARAVVLAQVRPPGRLAVFWQQAGRHLERILRHTLPDAHPGTRGFVAMFLGRKSELGQVQKEAHLQSGTMHLFAISGLHIGMIACCLHTLLALLRVRPWPACVAGTVLLTTFVEATGGSPSARRALVMVAMVWIGTVLRRPSNPLAAWSASALAVLVVNPLALLSASFQMSYAVVAAILFYGVPLRNFLQGGWRPLQGMTDDEIGARHRALEGGGRGLLSLVAVSLAASVVSLPLSVTVFHLASPGAVLSNIVVLPAAALAVTAGFASLLSGLLGLWPLAGLFNHAGALVVWLISEGAGVAARVPGMFFHGTFAASWHGTAVVLLLLGVCLIGYARRWRRPRAVLALPPLLALAAIVWLVTPADSEQKRSAMKSAYELAMERLQRSDPDASPRLSDEQKAQLAEIDRVYQGKLAEREIFLNQRLAEAQASSQIEEVEQIRKQITSERARLEEDREDAKNRVRRGAGKQG